jgi:hypothetical protein
VKIPYMPILYFKQVHSLYYIPLTSLPVSSLYKTIFSGFLYDTFRYYFRPVIHFELTFIYIMIYRSFIFVHEYIHL